MKNRFIQLFVAIPLMGLFGIGQSGNAVSPITKFYKDLRGASTLPSFEDLHGVQLQIVNANSDEMRQALPFLIADLSNPSTDIQTYAVAGLYSVALRGDGGDLLSQYGDAILHLLETNDERLQMGGIQVLATMKPGPPSSTKAHLNRFLERTDASSNAQVGAIWSLVRSFPIDAESVSSIDSFFGRELSASSRTKAINALGSPQVKDQTLLSRIGQGLRDPDADVKLASIRSINKIGIDAINTLRPELQKLANDSNSTSEVRDAAGSTLKRSH